MSDAVEGLYLLLQASKAYEISAQLLIYSSSSWQNFTRELIPSAHRYG